MSTSPSADYIGLDTHGDILASIVRNWTNNLVAISYIRLFWTIIIDIKYPWCNRCYLNTHCSSTARENFSDGNHTSGVSSNLALGFGTAHGLTGWGSISRPTALQLKQHTSAHRLSPNVSVNYFPKLTRMIFRSQLKLLQ